MGVLASHAHALVRHLPVDAEGLCYGRLDLPAGGNEGAEAVLAALRGFPARHLISSPARRCRSLADTIGAASGLPCRLDARLRELDFGAWEGLPWDSVPRPALDEWAADPWGFAPPGGESGAALVARLRAFHAELPDAAIIVAHGGSLKVLRALLAGVEPDLLSPAQPPGSVLFSPMR